MEITETMIQAAIRKATEAGLFPRHSTPFDMAINREIMRSILQAVAEAAAADATKEDSTERPWTSMAP